VGFVLPSKQPSGSGLVVISDMSFASVGTGCYS
jgi:hypothetical protein